MSKENKRKRVTHAAAAKEFWSYLHYKCERNVTFSHLYKSNEMQCLRKTKRTEMENCTLCLPRIKKETETNCTSDGGNGKLPKYLMFSCKHNNTTKASYL